MCGEGLDLLQHHLLQFQCGGRTPRCQRDAGMRPIGVDGVVCSDRIRERECLKLGLAAAARCMLHHAQNEMRGGAFHKGGPLGAIGVAYDHMETPVVVGVGVRLVTGVDHRARPCGGAGDGLVHECRTLGEQEPFSVESAGSGVDLPGDEEWQQHMLYHVQIHETAHEVVLVATE